MMSATTNKHTAVLKEWSEGGDRWKIEYVRQGTDVRLRLWVFNHVWRCSGDLRDSWGWPKNLAMDIAVMHHSETERAIALLELNVSDVTKRRYLDRTSKTAAAEREASLIAEFDAVADGYVRVQAAEHNSEGGD